jgi:hypothetical protein
MTDLWIAGLGVQTVNQVTREVELATWAAVAAVRNAPRGERYDRLIDLARGLRGGEVI